MLLDSHPTYRLTHEITRTPLTEALAKQRLIPEHEHEWLFGHGGGNGIKCAIGPGRHIRRTAESTNVAAFVGAIVKYTDTNSVSKWLGRLQDAKYSYAILISVGHPKEGVLDSAERFNEWLVDGPEEWLAYEEERLK